MSSFVLVPFEFFVPFWVCGFVFAPPSVKLSFWLLLGKHIRGLKIENCQKQEVVVAGQKSDINS